GLVLALVGGVALPASVFALGSTGRAGRGALAYPVFVASMCVVPLAANTMTFVMAWELMSLASYFLVLHEREERASVRAAWVYAVMTHAGLVCLLAGMLLMGAWTGSPRFADWRVAAPALGAAARSVAFVLLALVDHDLKRLLAFSSIENVGIILIGTGAGMLYHGAGLEGLALLALAAALYHTINHAAFKTLLFLGAGAVVHATGTRNMEG